MIVCTTHDHARPHRHQTDHGSPQTGRSEAGQEGGAQALHDDRAQTRPRARKGGHPLPDVSLRRRVQLRGQHQGVRTHDVRGAGEEAARRLRLPYEEPLPPEEELRELPHLQVRREAGRRGRARFHQQERDQIRPGPRPADGSAELRHPERRSSSTAGRPTRSSSARRSWGRTSKRSWSWSPSTVPEPGTPPKPAPAAWPS
jgi:hypothetical protein